MSAEENGQDDAPAEKVCGVIKDDRMCRGTRYIDLGVDALKKFLDHPGIKRVANFKSLRLVKCTTCGSTSTLDIRTHADAISRDSSPQKKGGSD